MALSIELVDPPMKSHDSAAVVGAGGGGGGCDPGLGPGGGATGVVVCRHSVCAENLHTTGPGGSPGEVGGLWSASHADRSVSPAPGTT